MLKEFWYIFKNPFPFMYWFWYLLPLWRNRIVSFLHNEVCEEVCSGSWFLVSFVSSLPYWFVTKFHKNVLKQKKKLLTFRNCLRWMSTVLKKASRRRVKRSAQQYSVDNVSYCCGYHGGAGPGCARISSQLAVALSADRASHCLHYTEK